MTCQQRTLLWIPCKWLLQGGPPRDGLPRGLWRSRVPGPPDFMCCAKVWVQVAPDLGAIPHVTPQLHRNPWPSAWLLNGMWAGPWCGMRGVGCRWSVAGLPAYYPHCLPKLCLFRRSHLDLPQVRLPQATVSSVPWVPRTAGWAPVVSDPSRHWCSYCAGHARATQQVLRWWSFCGWLD